MRTTICLNGEWDFMPLYDHPSTLELPPSLQYESRRVQVPSSWRSSYVPASGKRFGIIPEHDFAPFDLYGYPREWDDAGRGVLHRSIEIPPSMGGDGTRICLRFDGIMQRAAVYLDHERIAVWEDGYLPLAIDVTERVKPGKIHHLHVVCASFAKVRLPSGQEKVTGLTGSWFGYFARGIWQDVWLDSKPALALSRVAVRTSVRRGELEAEAAVAGMGELPAGARVLLSVREKGQNEGAPLLQAEAYVKIWNTPTTPDSSTVPDSSAAPDIRGRVSFRLDWQDATLWTPDQPFLYQLELTLLVDGQVVDQAEETFGFREVWSQGARFMLNGIPISLRGDSWHFQGAIQQTEAYVRNWYAMCKTAGVNYIRLHAEPHPEYYLDIADEMGMLIVDETAIYGSGKSMQADHPDYIANCKAHVRRLVERDRNHPSIIMWSVQNEMRWVDGRDGYKLHIPAMMDSIRELDGTRPIIVEGDNRLLPKELTEVESRHYNIDGTIDQWDRTVPLVFGEHGGWWYVCPQNSSMYVGLNAYKNTDECVKGLAQKERLFVEYARRQGVSGISTFNFAHYFMRAMPDRDIPLPPAVLETPGPKPRVIPKYSLSLNNGLLPGEYPSYLKNPSFDIMAECFKPAVLIPVQYNRAFFDDEPVTRSFDVYNDTLYPREVRVEIAIRQGERTIKQESFRFIQEPAAPRTVSVTWEPEPADDTEAVALDAVLYHDETPVHELSLAYRLYSSRCKTSPVDVARPAAFVGRDRDYRIIRTFVPQCTRIAPHEIAGLSPELLLIAGSRLEDADGQLEPALHQWAAQGGRVLLLEQLHLSMGGLAVSRQDFIRAHGGSYTHPVLQGLDDDAFMFWHEELREEGPVPVIRAAFEKPVQGSFTLLLECSAGDFGDGGDLWSPLLEYNSGQGGFVASQLELMDNWSKVPPACILLRNLLAYAGRAGKRPASATAVLTRGEGAAKAFLKETLGLAGDWLHNDAGQTRLDGYSLIIAEASLLKEPQQAKALLSYAEKGGRIVVLPAEPEEAETLSALLGRPVTIASHEAYHLEADYSEAAVQGFSPVDLFGFDKVHLSPREVFNRPLALYSLSVEGGKSLCASVENTAWKDYFVRLYPAEYSKLALVEFNRDSNQTAGDFVVETQTGEGAVLCCQLLMNADSDKAIRLYTRLLANLGAEFADNVLKRVKGEGQWAVESVMSLPCPPHVNYEAMKAYYTDPEFSLNNLGEGLYGWMKKKERRAEDGAFLIREPGGVPWFLSCFVHVHDRDGQGSGNSLQGFLQIKTGLPYEIYVNGRLVPEPGEHIELQYGINRLIAIVQSTQEDIRFGMVLRNKDGSFMRNLQYRLTMDEVEPK